MKMKKKLITLVMSCVFVAPLGFAQSANNEARPAGERSQSTKPSNSNNTGSIASYEPGKNITLNLTTETHPVRYVVAPDVHYMRQGGGAVTPDVIKQGAKVQVGFNAEGHVNRITLIDQR